MRGAFTLDEPSDERWHLALDLLTTGEAAVAIGNLNLYRDATGPRADGRLHVEVRASSALTNLTIAIATADVASGLAQLDDLRADERFAALVAEHGLTTDYVSDDDIGRTRLASVAADRSLEWQPPFAPRT